MSVVEPLTRGMIEKYLKSTGLRYLQDSDGDFVVQFGQDADWGCELDLYITAAGSNNEVLDMMATPSHHVSEDRWPSSILVCNQWNTEKRWPKAIFRPGKPNAKSGMFLLQTAIDFEKGVHQELLDDQIQVFIAGTYNFLKWLHESKGY